MIIEQSKSLGKTLKNLSKKQCKIFLFSSDIPANKNLFTFDPTDPISMYNECSAVIESEFLYNDDTSSIIFRGVPGDTGIHFKGHGSDISRSGQINNLVPLSVDTNIEIEQAKRFDFLNVFNHLPSNRWYSNTYIQVGDYIEFEFEANSQIDGIDYRFPATYNYGHFSVKYFDEALNEGNGDWATALVVDSNNVKDRIEFAEPINSSRVRVQFDVAPISTVGIESIYFFSNKTDFVNTPKNDVTWGLILFDLVSHTSVNVLGTTFPFIWMNVGSALSPSEMVLAKTNHQPAQAARLVHCEIVADEVEDV